MTHMGLNKCDTQNQDLHRMETMR